ncbi:AAA family ATPase [Embleya sp. MST-111070]|uniref:AAA family ATPase n=1 Tax=Embleya sp. MST-111070 TaxID=3398231 RepID=UPI003F73C37A
MGQDDTYYERLNGFDPLVRRAVLKGLRDMAFDEDAYAVAEREAVTNESLLRFVEAAVVREQFRRIARGGDRLKAFEVTYQAPASGEDRLELSFAVDPDTLPPSNVHVLTGRNGVGKSLLLHHLAWASLGDEVSPSREPVGRIGEVDRDGPRSFNTLVSVSFSVFDHRPFPDSKKLAAYRVGLVHPTTTGQPRTKSQSELAQEFAESMEACLNGAQAERWLAALRTLCYSGSGLLEPGWLDDFEATAEADQRRIKARLLFASLSSGHKAVLLAVTHLVHHVGERTLVLVDEPETHLHPPLLSAFVRVLSDLFNDRNGLAILATHSPVVLQEVPRHCVYKLRRQGTHVAAERPRMETYGENVGILTHEVFGLEITDTGFHRDLNRLVEQGLSFDALVRRFGGRLGAEARIIARSLIATRDTGGNS